MGSLRHLPFVWTLPFCTRPAKRIRGHSPCGALGGWHNFCRMRAVARFFCSRRGGAWILFFFSAITSSGVASTWVDSTVIVANANDPESVEIAEAYQQFRNIPENNVIVLPLPTSQEISRAQFVEELLNPLRAELLERELFNGGFLGSPDVHGRKPMMLIEQNVRYMVLCRGVPLKVRGSRNNPEDTELFEAYLRQLRQARNEPDFEFPHLVLTSAASVDSELTLLAVNGTPVTAFLANPLVARMPPPDQIPLIRVTRLDGPTKASVLAMLEGVREVEENGLKGRAYFDLRGILDDQPLKMGDDWIADAAKIAEELDFDVVIDTEGKVFDESARMDGAAIYMGWYAGHVTGPFTVPGFSFAPGALAFHLHSYSASNPSSTERHWVGPLIDRGAGATVGNVYEPYLSQTHRFSIILRMLAEGYNFGDAVYAAIPNLSWMGAAFGDPLYEPFKVAHREKLASARILEDAELDPYVLLGEAGRLAQEDRSDAAIELLSESLEKSLHPALLLRLARLEDTAGSRRRAVERLEQLLALPAPRPSQWGLWLEAARLLDEWNKTNEAAAFYRLLLADNRLPTSLEKILLKEGVDATMWHNSDEADAWEERLTRIEATEQREREKEAAEKAAREAQTRKAAEDRS